MSNTLASIGLRRFFTSKSLAMGLHREMGQFELGQQIHVPRYADWDGQQRNADQDSKRRLGRTANADWDSKHSDNRSHMPAPPVLVTGAPKQSEMHGTQTKDTKDMHKQRTMGLNKLAQTRRD